MNLFMNITAVILALMALFIYSSMVDQLQADCIESGGQIVITVSRLQSYCVLPVGVMP